MNTSYLVIDITIIEKGACRIALGCGHMVSTMRLFSPHIGRFIKELNFSMTTKV